jgi:hypothetical protein
MMFEILVANGNGPVQRIGGGLAYASFSPP